MRFIKTIFDFLLYQKKLIKYGKLKFTLLIFQQDLEVNPVKT